MIRTLHPIAGIIAFLTILTFWLSTITVELGGNPAAIATVKLGILWSLLLLVPAQPRASLASSSAASRSAPMS